MTESRLLIRGGCVLTMNGQLTTYDDGFVATRNGAIEAVGAGTPEPAQGVHVIDASGCVVLPGFVNAHTHLAMTLFRGIADDLCLQDFLTRVVGEESRTLGPSRVLAGAIDACRESILSGTTAALDMYWFPDETVRAGERFGVNVATGPAFANFATPEGTSVEEKLDHAERRLAQSAANPGSAPQWLMPHSTYALTGPQLRALGELAARYGARIHVHAAENAREVESVRDMHGGSPIEVLAETRLLTARTVVAHAVELSERDIVLLAEAGAFVAHCPWSNLKLASGIAPVRALIEAGVKVCLGTDGAVSSNSLDVWSSIRLAATLHKWRERDPAAVGSRDVMAMATHLGAAALGLEESLGSLEPGKQATMQIVELSGPHHAGPADVWSALAYSARPGDVRDVIVAGRQIVRNRSIVHGDS
ncbi:amidohydrolase family protein [Hoyosella altamirensis]|uniref:5-methylthioadenosine/S-adenosylhomocysteine deaminase n=1 Tax=Hoyosella altamirensis TaxID=616997 RepID=A0A839RKM3_9ACTN|nr:amidohydrolase [Hoyosella altamirensis]MBB3037225.1 5-methylthioadenosine/S-adenosylhomocysteine deaminase [Hoyosella altamirensis]